MDKKLLAISGGGCLTVGPATLMTHVEYVTRQSPLRLFDAFAGTSAGSILAALYALGWDTEDVKEIIEKNAKDIFYKPWYYAINPFLPKYSNTKLKAFLRKIFGEIRLSDIKTPLYITASDMSTNRTKVFHTGDPEYLWYAVLCSCAAPTYFKPVDKKFADGALWANDPTLVGTLGYCADYDCLPEEMHVMALITGGDAVSNNKVSEHWTKLQWIKPVLDFFMLGEENAIQFFAKNMPLGTYLRLAPKVDHRVGIDRLDMMKKYSDKWLITYRENIKEILEFCS